MPALERDPTFQSSAFALVPKKDKPLHLDGRIIHDLAAPDGLSVNAQTDSVASPDATWDPFISLKSFTTCQYTRIMHQLLGGCLPCSSHGIGSGMAVFGWTSSPGFFAVFGKAVRHYPRTGHSLVLGHMEPFWSFHWVDDIVLVEVDVDDRLQKAEKRLRDGVKLVFGSDGWHESKFTTWSRVFHAVGIDWNLPDEYITVPQRKIDKLRSVLAETLEKAFLSRKRLDSVIGVLRHVISFIPITKPFIQRLTAVQNRCRSLASAGAPMTEFFRKDLQWWQTLVFQTEFAGMPMNLFDHTKAFDEVWLVTVARNAICITSMKLQEQLLLKQRSQARDDNDLAHAVFCVTEMWGSSLSTEGTWCHVVIHGERWITELIDKMNFKSPEGQQALRQCYVGRQRVEEKRDQLKQASVSAGTLGSYNRNFKFWETFCSDIGFPVWIDELPRARQARMVGLFAALCASEGHNKARKGNKYQTFDGKMAAVAFAHKAVRNAKLDYHDPEFELIAQGYKRSHDDVDRKQPVTTPMLLKMYELRARHDTESDLMWGSIVLAFFFLDRSSEL
ncbi:hypothetical protein PR002_g7309 [Phytophthora rubi]|uniref:Reverse transcriptase domain-containing protein n=1 Tax=Phytophthora rubi TaxID=129364 RepID=A0A6A3N315_9STRA|nr:hypothetical protein PR002_g7309 [Phytophthora rubi]